jgi:hypothetical protein
MAPGGRDRLSAADMRPFHAIAGRVRRSGAGWTVEMAEGGQAAIVRWTTPSCGGCRSRTGRQATGSSACTRSASPWRRAPGMPRRCGPGRWQERGPRPTRVRNRPGSGGWRARAHEVVIAAVLLDQAGHGVDAASRAAVAGDGQPGDAPRLEVGQGDGQLHRSSSLRHHGRRASASCALSSAISSRRAASLVREAAV